MKKARFLSVCLIVLMLFTLGVSAAPAVEGRKTCTAYIADITVDGNNDEVAWTYAPQILVDVVKQNASSWYGDSSKKQGYDYAVLVCKVLWDGDDTLYVLFHAKDPTISMSGSEDWLKDSIELFVQMDNEAQNASAPKIQQRWFADGTANGHDNQAGFQQKKNSLIYEVAIDISTLKDGNFIGIDFQYNDDAEGKGERNICLGWSDSTDKASSDCTVYGQCELSSTTVADLIAAEPSAKPAPDTGDRALLWLAAAAVCTLCLKKRFAR